MCLDVNCDPVLLAKWPGSFTCHYSITGLERTANKSQRRKLCLDVTCDPVGLAKWPGSFTCHYSITGLERTANKSQRRKLTLENKIV